MIDLFPDTAERARAIAVWSGASALGVAIGPTVGGWLLVHFAWGSIFAVNLPIAALALIAGWFVVPASGRTAATQVRPVGMVLAAASSGTLTYTIIEAGTAAGPAASRSPVGAERSADAAFVAWEARAAHPMIDLGMFRDPRFAVASGAVAILFFAWPG